MCIRDRYIADRTTVTSDARDKVDDTDITYGLDFVNDLRPIQYRWNYRSHYHYDSEDAEGNTIRLFDSEMYTQAIYKGSRYHTGFLAQDVREIDDSQDDGYAFAGVKVRNSEHLSLAETEMIAPMVKAIQELSQLVDDLKARIEELES